MTKKPALYMPHPCKLSWNKGLLNNGVPHRLRGFGAYFDLERDDLTDTFLDNYCWFLYDCGFNMLQVFGSSRFSKYHLNFLGLNSWCPWKMVDGKYDLRELNSKYLENMQRFAVYAMRWGIALEICLFDECGFKSGPANNYGWIIHPYNKNNVAPGSPGWETGSANYFKYHKCWNESKYPLLRQTNELYVRGIAQSMAQYQNVIFKLINEPSENIVDFENLVIDWLQDQYMKVGAPRFPIISSSGDFLIGKNRIDLKCTHNHLNEIQGYNEYDTDGSRITEWPGDPLYNYNQKMRYLHLQKKHHIATHMNFFSTLPGMNDENIHALTWLGGKHLADPRTDWLTKLGQYLAVHREIAIDASK